jgi:hypothetical protein
MHEEEPLRPDKMSAEMAQETQETVASLEKDSGAKGVRGQTRSGREIKNKTSFVVSHCGFPWECCSLVLLLLTVLSRGMIRFKGGSVLGNCDEKREIWLTTKHVGNTAGRYWSWVKPPECGITASVVVNKLVLCSKRCIFRPTLLSELEPECQLGF